MKHTIQASKYTIQIYAIRFLYNFKCSQPSWKQTSPTQRQPIVKGERSRSDIKGHRDDSVEVKSLSNAIIIQEFTKDIELDPGLIRKIHMQTKWGRSTLLNFFDPWDLWQGFIPPPPFLPQEHSSRGIANGPLTTFLSSLGYGPGSRMTPAASCSVPEDIRRSFYIFFLFVDNWCMEIWKCMISRFGHLKRETLPPRVPTHSCWKPPLSPSKEEKQTHCHFKVRSSGLWLYLNHIGSHCYDSSAFTLDHTMCCLCIRMIYESIF